MSLNVIKNVDPNLNLFTCIVIYDRRFEWVGAKRLYVGGKIAYMDNLDTFGMIRIRKLKFFNVSRNCGLVLFNTYKRRD